MITYIYVLYQFQDMGRSSRKFTRFSTCIARGFQDIKQLQGDASHFIVYECGAGKEIAVFSSRQGNFQSLKNDDEEEEEEE